MRVDLKRSLFVLPNLFTLGSIFCGFYAVILLGTEEAADRYYRASMLIVLAMFLDTIDGRVARLTRTQSAIGVQLDSLADLVSFGVAPALLVYKWSLQEFGWLGILCAFIFVATGAIRLARFNVMAMGQRGKPNRPSKYTSGLPIPGAAGILVSLTIAQRMLDFSIPRLHVWLLFLLFALSLFMVSRIRFRSFKDFKLNPLTITLVGFALLTGAVISLRYHISLALAWLLLSYVGIGLIETVFRMLRKRGVLGRNKRQSNPIQDETSRAGY